MSFRTLSGLPIIGRPPSALSDDDEPLKRGTGLVPSNVFTDLSADAPLGPSIFVLVPDRANVANVFPGLDWGGIGTAIPGNTASFVDDYPSADLGGNTLLRFTGSLGVTVMDLRLTLAPLSIPAGAWNILVSLSSDDLVTTNARMILELNNSTGAPIVTRNAYWPADTNPHVPPDFQISNALFQYVIPLTGAEIALMDPTKQPWRFRMSYSGGALSILRHFDCSAMALIIPA